MKTKLAVLFAVTLASVLVACTLRKVEFCEQSPRHRTCRDAGDSDGGAEGGVDAAGDASSDSSTDSGLDSSLSCPGHPCEEPLVCDDGQCIACRSDEKEAPDPGCSAKQPVCDKGARSCVECATHEHCTADPQRPRCDDVGVCEPGGGECRDGSVCFADDPTAGDDDLAVALEGACVTCNVDDDCGPGLECDAWTHACVVPAGNVGQCQSCIVDGDCTDGSCVEVSFGGQVVGTYCALGGCGGEADPDFWCAGMVGRGQHCLSVQTRQGTEDDFCVPATTTCEGYTHHRLPCAGLQGACSHDGDGGDADGLCAGGTTCTYPCDETADCPGGYGCGTQVGGHCDT